MADRKSKHLSYKLVESELFRLGDEIKRINKDFDNKDLKGTGLKYVYRCRWLNKIIDELNFLYEKVDDQTKLLMKSLYINSKSMKKVSQKLNKSEKEIKEIHRLIVNVIMVKLGMIDKFDYIPGELNRYINAETKRKVNNKYNSKCAKCSSENNLHYHHIHKFSEGGSNDEDNIMLLCALCHAEEHKNESVYRVLKAVAEG